MLFSVLSVECNFSLNYHIKKTLKLMENVAVEKTGTKMEEVWGS